MSHVTRWLVDKRVLLVEYTGEIGKDELVNLNEELALHIETGIEPVHIISDNTNMRKMPMNISVLRKTFGVMNNSKWGMVCIVGSDSLLSFFTQVIRSSFQLRKISLLHTVDEAIQAIQDFDETLSSTA